MNASTTSAAGRPPGQQVLLCDDPQTRTLHSSLHSREWADEMDKTIRLPKCRVTCVLAFPAERVPAQFFADRGKADANGRRVTRSRSQGPSRMSALRPRRVRSSGVPTGRALSIVHRIAGQSPSSSPAGGCERSFRLTQRRPFEPPRRGLARALRLSHVVALNRRPSAVRAGASRKWTDVIVSTANHSVKPSEPTRTDRTRASNRAG